MARESSIPSAKGDRTRFRMAKPGRFAPRALRISVPVLDITPEEVSICALSRAASLLATIRHNRMIDLFLSISTRTTRRAGVTDDERERNHDMPDEVYVGMNSVGRGFVVPVVLQELKDRRNGVRMRLSVAWCAGKFPNLTCRPVSAQFMGNGVIAMFELALVDGELGILEERHYKLIPADQIGVEDLKRYAAPQR